MSNWSKELEIRKVASIGTIFYIGRCNFGRDELILPLVSRTKTQLVCSDGERTERIMIGSGRVVGRAFCVAKLHKGGAL